MKRRDARGSIEGTVAFTMSASILP
jgi:hypothetical protein